MLVCAMMGIRRFLLPKIYLGLIENGLCRGSIRIYAEGLRKPPNLRMPVRDKELNPDYKAGNLIAL